MTDTWPLIGIYHIAFSSLLQFATSLVPLKSDRPPIERARARLDRGGWMDGFAIGVLIKRVILEYETLVYIGTLSLSLSLFLRIERCKDIFVVTRNI